MIINEKTSRIMSIPVKDIIICLIECKINPLCFTILLTEEMNCILYNFKIDKYGLTNSDKKQIIFSKYNV
jgi:hypothetical protein